MCFSWYCASQLSETKFRTFSFARSFFSKSTVVLRFLAFFSFLYSFAQLRKHNRGYFCSRFIQQFKQGESYWWLTHNPLSCQMPERRRMQKWRGIDNKGLANVGNECSCQAKQIETRGMSLLARFVNRQNSTTFSRPADSRKQNFERVFFFSFLEIIL